MNWTYQAPLDPFSQEKLQWISVKDRMPEVGDVIVVFRIDYPSYYSVMRYEAIIDETDVFTHWLPLPPFPKEES